jgi:DNA-binding YbaB/EbfC family protein
MIDGPMGDILKKAQELSQNMQSQQEDLAKKTVDVSVGGEMVKMTFNGKMEALSLFIDPEVVDPDDIETLRDLILSAVNEGIRRGQEIAQSEMGKSLGGMLGDLKIPGINA